MRVVGGTAKGIILKTARGGKIRPTSDKIRESLFNILSAEIEGSSFLDCYAGSGAIGIEALSRGAGKVIFVESDKKAVALIRENLERCHLGEKAIVIHKSFERSAKKVKEFQDSFDLIFADPPYQSKNYRELIEITRTQEMLEKQGWFIIEHLKKEALPDIIDDLRKTRVKYYGQTALSFYQFGINAKRSKLNG